MRFTLRYLFVAVLAVPACMGNEAGDIGATTLGDTSHPAERGSPLAALQAACGPGAMAPGGVGVRRQPYLQQVTTTSAMIGWVTTDPVGERIEVTTPAGAPVMTATSEVQRSKQRSADETQMWSTLSGLEPDTIYCYSLGAAEPRTERIGFRTAPLSTSTAPVRFMAFGDSGGGGPDQMALRDQMFDFPYDLIVHTGDIAYDSGTIAEFEDNVFAVYDELFKSVPFFPAAGNHEYETLQGAPFRDVFALPGDGGEQWYSYDWGRVHFVALDTEADYETQVEWLELDLAANELPWTIIYLHRPPYSSGKHGSDLRLRSLLEPIAERHGVQLVLAGHDHDYERMKPQAGVAYVVTGGGGRGTRDVGTSDFTAFSEAVIHFVYVEVGIDELVLHAIDATGTEFDSMVVPRVRK
ncbi:MAG: metallophosphoesterase [Deltaproteobacteria bacterium]|nr:metallophosphoesterase [Deltaproteobacteria bacterium]MDQ3296278.1 metallophosphoesterase [Myxococcota bacterium]